MTPTFLGRELALVAGSESAYEIGFGTTFFWVRVGPWHDARGASYRAHVTHLGESWSAIDAGGPTHQAALDALEQRLRTLHTDLGALLSPRPKRPTVAELQALGARLRGWTLLDRHHNTEVVRLHPDFPGRSFRREPFVVPAAVVHRVAIVPYEPLGWTYYDVRDCEIGVAGRLLSSRESCEKYPLSHYCEPVAVYLPEEP